MHLAAFNTLGSQRSLSEAWSSMHRRAFINTSGKGLAAIVTYSNTSFAIPADMLVKR